MKYNIIDVYEIFSEFVQNVNKWTVTEHGVLNIESKHPYRAYAQINSFLPNHSNPHNRV